MAATRDNPKRAAAGARWRELRLANDWKQNDVERETEARYDYPVRVSQLSHIERGDHGQISLDDAVTLGKLYGLTPNQVAAMYGLWSEQEDTKMPQALLQATAALNDLSYDLVDDFLGDIQHLLVRYKAKQRERANMRHRTEPPAAVVAK